MDSRGNGMRQVYYVPNRYFNQMRHDSHPDLFQVNMGNPNNE